MDVRGEEGEKRDLWANQSMKKKRLKNEKRTDKKKSDLWNSARYEVISVILLRLSCTSMEPACETCLVTV